MSFTDVIDSTNVLKFVYNASERPLFGICAAMVSLAVYEQKREVEKELKHTVNHEDIIGNEVFHINPELAVLLTGSYKEPGSDKEPFAGKIAEHEYIFVSLFQRNVVMVYDGELQYPDGGNIGADDLKALAGQNFYPVITNSHFPRNLNNAAALAKKQHNEFGFWSNTESRQSQASQDQPGAEPAFKPTHKIVQSS